MACAALTMSDTGDSGFRYSGRALRGNRARIAARSFFSGYSGPTENWELLRRCGLSDGHAKRQHYLRVASLPYSDGPPVAASGCGLDRQGCHVTIRSDSESSLPGFLENHLLHRVRLAG